MAGLTEASIANYLTFKMGTVDLTKELESISGGGMTSTIVEWHNFNKRYSNKAVGSASVEAYECTFTYNPADAGYIALSEALEDSIKSTFTITLHSGPGKTDGTILTFKGLVSSKSIATEYDTQRTVTFSIVVDGGVTESETV